MESINLDQTTEEASQATGCCQRFLWDIRISPFFSISEPHGQYINVASSFAGTSTSTENNDCGWLRQKWCILLYRSIVLVWCISTLILSLATSPHRWIWMGLLTIWSLIISIASLIFSCICTVWSKTVCEQPQLPTQHSEANGQNSPLLTPSLVVKVTWVLFTVAAVFEIMVTILYWTLLREDHNYETVMLHGIIALLVLVDGLVVGRTPVRFQHIIFVLIVISLYVIWTLLHSFLSMGKGNYRGENDKPLYNVLNWKEEPINSGILVLEIVFIGIPLIFMLLWILSVAGCRRCGVGQQGCCFHLDGRRLLYRPVDNTSFDNVSP